MDPLAIPHHHTHRSQSPLIPTLYSLSCSCSWKSTYSFDPTKSPLTNLEIISSILDAHYEREFVVPYMRYLRERYKGKMSLL